MHRFSVAQTRLFIFGILFAAALAFDFLKYQFIGGDTIANWWEWAHTVWVVFAPVSIFLAVFIPSLRNVFLILYTAVFAAALFNIYYPFSDILTYNCMLFNLVLATAYFFARKQYPY